MYICGVDKNKYSICIKMVWFDVVIMKMDKRNYYEIIHGTTSVLNENNWFGQTN